MTCISVRPADGRFLVLSPAWPGEDTSVLFDRNSGDYWVITSPARAVIQHLVDAARPLPMAELQQHVAPPDSPNTSQMIEELSALGILAMG